MDNGRRKIDIQRVPVVDRSASARFHLEWASSPTAFFLVEGAFLQITLTTLP